MNKEDFLELFNGFNIDDINNKFDLLEKYYNFLIEYNKHTNLTAITEKREVYIKHFYDSLTICNCYNFDHKVSVLDIGSGAGFPGVVLKIMFPNIKLTLLDSNNKKTTFLRELVDLLNLDDVTIINSRAEDYAKDHLNEYDLVVARAVANLRVLSELCLPFVKTQGYFFAMKGNVESELKDALKTIEILGSNVENSVCFQLPNGDKRSIIVIKKEKLTKGDILRPYNKILKSELK